MLERIAHELVYGRELGEVAGVGARGAEDEVGLLPEAARAEEEDHDEGVREAHLGAVHGAIARGLHDGQQVVVRRVEDYALDGGLRALQRGRHRASAILGIHRVGRGAAREGRDVGRRYRFIEKHCIVRFPGREKLQFEGTGVGGKVCGDGVVGSLRFFEDGM